MLVLTRRADEKIIFPNLGISIHLLRINGKIAKLGIDAPKDVVILRDELQSPSDKLAPAQTVRHTPTITADPLAAMTNAEQIHELCNRLSKLSLALHLFRRQHDLGLADQAETTLGRVFKALELLDRQHVCDLFQKFEIHPTSAIMAAEPHAEPLTRSVRALLVEDDSNERELLAGLLGMQGCECVTAANGTEALNYLDHNARPDVVLLDMMMPQCDGPTALKAIRANPNLRGLPVFAVSGTPPTDLGIPIGPTGIDRWFPKPLNPTSLCEAIRTSVPTTQQMR